MVYDYHYILGGIIASALVLAFVVYSSKAKGSKSNDCVVISNTSSENGKCPEENMDIIIVGAGVAGAALAYTLGKVEKPFLSFSHISTKL